MSCSDTKVETQRCDEVLADADKRLSQLGDELAQAKQAHEQALLRQQEHASQTERQLEVHNQLQHTTSTLGPTFPASPCMSLTLPPHLSTVADTPTA